MTSVSEFDPNFRFEMEVGDEHGFDAMRILLAEVDAFPHVQFVRQFVKALGTPVRRCALTEPERAVLRRGGRSMPPTLQERFIDRWHKAFVDMTPEASASLISHGFDHGIVESQTGDLVTLSDDFWFASHFSRYLISSTPGDLQWLASVRRRALTDLVAFGALNALNGDSDERQRSFLQAGPMGGR